MQIARSRIAAALATAVVLGIAPAVARSDYIVYPIPGTGVAIILEGEVPPTRSGGLVMLKTRFNKNMYFKLGRDIPSIASIKRVDTPAQAYAKAIRRVKTASDAKARAETYFSVGVTALKRGLLRQFYEAMELSLEADPAHARAKNVMMRRDSISEAASDAPSEMVKLVKLLNRKMQVARSAHFVLLYDTPDEVAQKRLKLLETVYESFLMFFWAHGVDLPRPTERMRVVLFNQYTDFNNFAVSLSPSLSSAAGFWDPKINVSFFFAYGTKEEFKVLRKLADSMASELADAKRRKLRGPGIADLTNYSKMLDNLVEVSRENMDIEVVSHEATHQMAGNCRLFPPEVRVPSWVHEGLATFFESPDDATWSGIGAVNSRRLQWYRGLQNDRKHSNIDFVVGDEIFDLAATHGSVLHAYGQAWALTHYMVNKHFDQLMEYYRLLAQLPPDMIFSPKILRRCFQQAFGADHRALDVQWRAHMDSLKTDIEKAFAED